MPDDSNPFRITGLSGMLGASLNSQRGLEATAKRMEGLKNASNSGKIAGQPGAKGQQDEVTKAATQFEALLLHQMLNEMWKSVPKDSLFDDGGHEQEMYRDMLNEGIANDIAEKQSIGIRDAVIRDMQKRLNK